MGAGGGHGELAGLGCGDKIAQLAQGDIAVGFHAFFKYQNSVFVILR
jgi:hypothetical protein